LSSELRPVFLTPFLNTRFSSDSLVHHYSKIFNLKKNKIYYTPVQLLSVLNVLFGKVTDTGAALAIDNASSEQLTAKHARQ